MVGKAFYIIRIHENHDSLYRAFESLDGFFYADGVAVMTKVFG